MNRSRLSYRQQRGAIGLSTAVLLVLLLFVLALIVDTARLYLLEREMQRVADLAALEAVGLGGVCATNSAVQSNLLARESAQRNGFNPAQPGHTLQTRVGKLQTDNSGRRQLLTGTTQASDALEVTVTKAISASLIGQLAEVFIPASEPGAFTLRASATAQREAMASFSVGSGLLNLDSTASPLLNPVLNGLLDGSVNLSALTPSGIANANVELLAFLELLRVQAEAATLEQVLDTRIQALPFVAVIAELLQQKGVLGANLSGAKLAQATPLNITLAQLLGVQGGTGQEALRAKVNLFELLLVGAFAANNQNSLNLNLSVPNLTSLRLYIIEKPKLAYGPPGRNAQGQWITQASTGQLELLIGVQTSLAGLLSTGGYLIDAQVDLGIRVGIAEAQAAFASVQCNPETGKPSLVTLAAQTQTDNIRVTRASNPNQPARVLLKVLGQPLLTVRLDVGGSPIIGSNSGDLHYTLTEQDNGTTTISPNPQDLYSPVALGLPALRVVSVTVGDDECDPGLLGLNCLLNGTLNLVLQLFGGVTALVSLLLSSLNSVLLEPLFSALGIRVGFANVTLLDAQMSGAVLVR